MELTIVIPTFNEKENIGILLDRIFQLSKKVKIIIVDDSPNQDIKTSH
jgi:glycosyltransferase involved in cell wall biosynthesis